MRLPFVNRRAACDMSVIAYKSKHTREDTKDPTTSACIQGILFTKGRQILSTGY